MNEKGTKNIAMWKDLDIAFTSTMMRFFNVISCIEISMQQVMRSWHAVKTEIKTKQGDCSSNVVISCFGGSECKKYRLLLLGVAKVIFDKIKWLPS